MLRELKITIRMHRTATAVSCAVLFIVFVLYIWPRCPACYSVEKQTHTKYFNDGRIKILSNVPYSYYDSEMTPEVRAEFIQNSLNRLEVECSKSKRFGTKDDGGWDLCLVGPYIPKPPCSLISFGINQEWGFEQELARMGCKVYAFDPTIGQKTRKVEENLWYYNLGLSDKQKVIPKVGKVDSLRNIIKLVNLSNTNIDILKMDIENSEYPALLQALYDGSLELVKQFMVEFHTFNSTPTHTEAKNLDIILRGMHDIGFRAWKYDWNIYNIRKSAYGSGRYRTTCNEVYYINTNFIM